MGGSWGVEERRWWGQGVRGAKGGESRPEIESFGNWGRVRSRPAGDGEHVRAPRGGRGGAEVETGETGRV